MADSMTRPPRRLTKPLRAQQGDALRERLLQAAVALIEGGVEPTMRAIAAEAGVAERTIYRYFESRDAFELALRQHLRGRGGVPLCETAAELDGYARSLFETFEANRSFIVAMLTAPWAARPLRGSRRENLSAMRALIDAAYPAAPDGARAAASSTLRALLSGAGWNYLRSGCGLDNESVIAHAQWAVRAVLRSLASRRPARAR